MTRKDYVLIAKVFADIVDDFGQGEAVQPSLIAEELADALAKDNPQFDRERFLTACGVK